MELQGGAFYQPGQCDQKVFTEGYATEMCGFVRKTTASTKIKILSTQVALNALKQNNEDN